MARQLTAEALRFIQHHHHVLPETDAYESAETLIDVERPFYARSSTADRQPASSAHEPLCGDGVLEAWLLRAEPVSPAVVRRRGWAWLIVRLRSLLWLA